MTTLEIKLDLPDRLAQDASSLGLLEPQNLRALLSEAVRSRRLARLAEGRQRVAAAGIAPISEDDILAEIDAYRAEQARHPGV